MHIVKLPWFGHKAEGKRVECYSISISADGTRLASGGLDGNVKIWDTHTVLQFKSVEGIDSNNDEFNRLLPPESQRRPLCSMSRHNGVVTAVKFSPDGRFLASGSDDKIVLIWEKDELMANRPKQFGEVEADLEHWTVRRRLVAHENDIQDICWSPDGSLLVTVGLDRLIIIWSGTTFERIKRYDIHQSMVKGIVFDPANKFFATASDDRTVRIFRYSKKLHESVNDYEFQMEHVVFDPFKNSPLTSYFRRMSWSPDGQNIAVPNAMNGPVPSVAIIKRGDWSTEISLIGHEAPCEVCSFSPKLFASKENSSKDKFYTILATGGQDNTLAIWSTSQSKPLLVAQDITESSITDICWSIDGETVYVSCLDGSITCVSFDTKELGIPVSAEMLTSQLHKFGRDRGSNVFPESIEQLELEEKADKLLDNTSRDRRSITPNVQNASPRLTPNPSEIESKLKTPSEIKEPQPSTPSKVNVLSVSKQSVIIMKNGKKRIVPTLISGLSNKSKLADTLTSVNKSIKKLKPNSKISHQSYLLPRSGVATAVRGTKEKHEEVNVDGATNDIDDMGEFAADQNNANVSVQTLKKQKNKMKKQIMEAKYPSCFKYISNLSEALFNHPSLLQYEMSKIINSHDFEKATDLFVGTSASADTNDEDIIFAVIVAGVTHEVNSNYHIEKPSDVLVRTTVEVRNGPPWEEDEEEMDLEYNDKIDFQDPTAVLVTHRGTSSTKYTIYYPFKIQQALPIILDNMLMYFVFVSFNGIISVVFAESGSLMCPHMEMGTNFVSLKQQNEYLMAVSSSGLLYIWKLPIFPRSRTLKCILNGVSIAPVVNTDVLIEPDSDSKVVPKINMPDVKALDIDPEDGSPIIMLSNSHDVFKYNIDLQCWTKVIDSWYFQAVVENKRGGKVLNSFYYVSSNGFKEAVQKNMLGKYVFNGDSELKQVMEQRYNEMTSQL